MPNRLIETFYFQALCTSCDLAERYGPHPAFSETRAAGGIFQTPAERHLIQRLVALFATGDSIVGNNLVLNLYQHINSPEARMYLSRQLYEESLHVHFYQRDRDRPARGTRAV